MIETKQTSGGVSLTPEIAALQNLIDAGEVDRARDTARAMQGFVPETEPDWIAYTKLLETLGLLAQTEIATAKFLDRVPGSWMARLKLASRLATAKKPNEAQAQVDLVMAAPVASREYFGRLTGVLWHLNNWPQLIETADAGLRHDPESFAMYQCLAVANNHLRRTRQTMAAFDSALIKAGTNINHLLQMVKTAEMLKLPSARDKAFLAALDLAVSGKRPKDWLDLIIFLKERPAFTDQACQAAAAASITDIAVLTAWFDFVRTAGPPAAALATGKKLLAAKPSTPGLAEKIARLQQAGPARSSDNWWQTVKSTQDKK